MASKKQRSKRPKVVIKHKSKHTRKRDVHDKEMKDRWDHKKTSKANLASMKIDEMYGPRLPKTKEDIPTRHPTKVNEDEAPIIADLVKKYGEENYSKMAMDHKINKWQWTVGFLKKKVPAFLQGKLRTMEGEMMSGRGHDMQKTFPRKSDKKRSVFGY